MSTRVRTASTDSAVRLGGVGALGKTAAFKHERQVERMMGEGVPNAVIAAALSLSDRQVRRIACRVRHAWASRQHDDFVDRAMVRLRDDAAKMRAIGTPKAIAVAVRIEALLLDAARERVGIARNAAHDVAEMDDAELAEAMATVAQAHAHLLGVGEPAESDPGSSCAPFDDTTVVDGEVLDAEPAAPMPDLPEASVELVEVQPDGRAFVALAVPELAGERAASAHTLDAVNANTDVRDMSWREFLGDDPQALATGRPIR